MINKKMIFCFLVLNIMSCVKDNEKNDDLNKYEIINRYENKTLDYDGTRQIGLIIKITNSEKLDILVNSINPVIYLPGYSLYTHGV